MESQASRLVRRLWHYCNVLRDDGLSYPDYVEQLTYLLFLKMADERGGEIVFFGTPAAIRRSAQSLTGEYLSGRKLVVAPRTPRAAAGVRGRARAGG